MDKELIKYANESRKRAKALVEQERKAARMAGNRDSVPRNVVKFPANGRES